MLLQVNLFFFFLSDLKFIPYVILSCEYWLAKFYNFCFYNNTLFFPPSNYIIFDGMALNIKVLLWRHTTIPLKSHGNF